MLGTYASAALICAASMLVGRALLSDLGASRLVLARAGGRLRRDHHRHRAALAGGRARHHGDARGGWSLVIGAAAVCLRERYDARGALRCRPAGRDRDRGGADDPLPGQRPLGADRGRLQQRPRPAPGLGRVAAQRLRPRTLRRLPARPARARGRGRRGPGHLAGPGLPRRDLRDQRHDRADRAGGALRPRRRCAACSRRRWSPSPTSPPPTSPRAPSRRPPRRSSCSPRRWRCAIRRGPPAGAGRGCAAASPTWRSPAASSSPTASPASPGRSRSWPSGA